MLSLVTMRCVYSVSASLLLRFFERSCTGRQPFWVVSRSPRLDALWVFFPTLVRMLEDVRALVIGDQLFVFPDLVVGSLRGFADF